MLSKYSLYLSNKREPRLLGEVIRDLIEQGKVLPNYKCKNNG